MPTFHIIFPRGDRDKVAIVELSDGCRHELADYFVASRLDFPNFEIAHAYAKLLAEVHGKQLTGDDDERDRAIGYLD